MQIPSEWKEVLSKVQSVFPGAVIAGGALRDLHYGTPIKDVDIFCPVDQCPDGLFDAPLSSVFGYDLLLHKSSCYGRNDIPDADRTIYAIYGLNNHEYDYDIIVAAPLECQIKTFDLSICQISFDGSRIKTSEEYDRTREDKVIRVLNINRTDRQRNRVERMLVKFPDFAVDPALEDKFEQLI